MRRGESDLGVQNMLKSLVKTLFNDDKEICKKVSTKIPFSTGSPLRKYVKVDKKALPLCEFDENNKIFSLAFPHRFILGKSITTKGSIAADEKLHLMLQTLSTISKDAEALFLILNQAQRHAACSAVSVKLKNDAWSFRKFSELQNSEEFKTRVANALKDPNGRLLAFIIIYHYLLLFYLIYNR